MTFQQRTIKMIVTYDGSTFRGFQYQPVGPTVQDALELAAEAVLRERVRVNGSGRTDAGVHAAGQVIAIRTSCPVPVDKLIYAMNNLLPSSIRITFAEDVPADFHPRFSAVCKHYRYLIRRIQVFSPFLDRFFWQIEKPLDIGLMQKGAKLFEGEHDFSAFSANSSKVNSTIREIFKSCLSEEGQVVCFDVIGKGFLYKMVRNMVKALVLIGLRQIPVEAISELFAGCEKYRLGACAPPNGLYLMKVFYENIAV